MTKKRTEDAKEFVEGLLAVLTSVGDEEAIRALAERAEQMREAWTHHEADRLNRLIVEVRDSARDEKARGYLDLVWRQVLQAGQLERKYHRRVR